MNWLEYLLSNPWLISLVFLALTEIPSVIFTISISKKKKRHATGAGSSADDGDRILRALNFKFLVGILTSILLFLCGMCWFFLSVNNKTGDSALAGVPAPSASSSYGSSSNTTSAAAQTASPASPPPTDTQVSPSPSPSPDEKEPLEIKITSPKDGDTLPLNCIVEGTIKGKIPEDEFYWIVVNPKKSMQFFWPQGGALTDLNGSWMTEIRLGNEDSAGQTFYIYIVRVNAADNNYYYDYLQKGYDTKKYPGIRLPKDAKRICMVSVVRK